MRQTTKELAPSTNNIRLLLAYVADFELEVDRLPKQGQFIQHEARGTLKRVRRLCAVGACAWIARRSMNGADRPAARA